MRTKERSARLRGVSLAELLIALGLFGLLATMIAALVRTGFTYLSQAEDRAELQRSSLFLLSDMSREIAESSPDCLRFANVDNDEDPGLVFASPRGADGLVEYQNSHLLWKKWVAIWWDQEAKRVYRVEELLPTPSTFKPDPSPGGLDKSPLGLATTPSLPRWVLAHNVSGFTIEGEGGLEVTITLQVEVNQGERRSRLTTRTGVRPNH